MTDIKTLMKNQPRESWERRESGIYMPKTFETNKGAFIRAKQAEMDAAYQRVAEQMSARLFYAGDPPKLTPWQRRKARVRYFFSRWSNRFRDAWLCLARGYVAEDPDEQDY